MEGRAVALRIGIRVIEISRWRAARERVVSLDGSARRVEATKLLRRNRHWLISGSLLKRESWPYKGRAMPVIRIIHVTFPPDQAQKAERNWMESCAPIMIRQSGCRSEELLRSKDNPGEYISYSEWDSEDSIKAYLASEAHQEIKRHNSNITGARVEVKHYERIMSAPTTN